MLFAKKNAVRARPKIKKVRLRIARCSEMPVDFIAANSYRSEKPPNTIKEVTNMVSGKTKGINLGAKNHRNFNIMKKSMSLPASSAMYNQMVCNTKMNIKIMKTLKNVFK
jgi:NAD(P)H-dependent flavin oxidoreductase YrpB (nitropropane dioxygenase family)